MTRTTDNAAAVRRKRPDETSGDEPRGQGAVFALAMMLAALAGFIDAAGYIHFHHLFVSFMSGNSTQATVAAATGDFPKLAVLGRTIILFVAGVTVGELVGALSTRWGRPLVLLLESLLLGVALAAVLSHWSDSWTSSTVALAMGIQNAAVHKAEGISVALTYVTGTLVHVGRGIAGALRGTKPWHGALPFVGLWIGLACGGFAGSLAATRSMVLALTVATGTCLALMLWSAVISLVAPGSEPG